ncbi:WD REPEATS REGION domain-containing protein [Abeliophyllum distichum]|uniref:WD REPEATS REGION domain-containing protein n=1 Tax=Abeliophyllum distichum TaxID=126358 RepID=A0ABD1U187_9LAMI
MANVMSTVVMVEVRILVEMQAGYRPLTSTEEKTAIESVAGKQEAVVKLCDLGIDDRVCSVGWAQHGTHLAIGTSNGKLEVQEAQTQETGSNIASVTNHIVVKENSNFSDDPLPEIDLDGDNEEHVDDEI